MHFKTIIYAAALAALPAAAEASVVTVNFGGTYNAGEPLAGTTFTGSFAYDDQTLPSYVGSFFGDGTIQQRRWANFLTSPFTITNTLGTSSVSAADARLIINYTPYAGAAPGTTSFDLNSGFSSPYQQFSLGSTLPGFAATGLPKASDFVLSPTLGGYGYTDNGGSGRLTSLSASVAAVPEPATWAMLIAGFGIVGVTMRRKKAAQVSFA